ncbi:hypothetical protein [Streptomyces cucumeris]|uniref:hypothetical protein n=1 Tax=Streptomyces cucumeris TaxID=2962890 RepID=UPI003D719C31
MVGEHADEPIYAGPGKSAVVPDPQPMSIDPFAQFKGHRRLYEAPVRMGYRILPEDGLQPLPPPFV